MPTETPYEVHYISWIWFLLEKLKTKEPEVIISYLINALNDSKQPIENKINACRLLITLGMIEGLAYWRDYIIANKTLPFDHRQDVIIQHCPMMPINEVVSIVNEVLDFTYTNNLHETLAFPYSIEDAVYAIFHAAAMSSLHSFEIVMIALDGLYQKFVIKSFARHIAFHKERIAQDFYRRYSVEYSLTDALALYSELTAFETEPPNFQ